MAQGLHGHWHWLLGRLILGRLPPHPGTRSPVLASSSCRNPVCTACTQEVGSTAPSWRSLQGPEMGTWAQDGPTHTWLASLPGAEWRQPPCGGLAGARQGLAPPPHEEQEVPGRTRCHGEEAPGRQPLPPGQHGRAGAGASHGTCPQPRTQQPATRKDRSWGHLALLLAVPLCGPWGAPCRAVSEHHAWPQGPHPGGALGALPA